jgi:predicted permease
MHNIRSAWRSLLKTPGISGLAAMTLALGIGANTAIFSVVNGVLLRPLPFANPERVVRVWLKTADDRESGLSAADFLDLRRQNRSLQALAGYRQDMMSAVAAGEPVLVPGSFVTLDFFDVFGAAAAHGRTFSRAQDPLGGERAVVLSDEAARQLFADPAAAPGRRVRLNGEAHTVLGVMPPGFEWPQGARVWVLSAREVPPAPVEGADSPTSRDVGYLGAVARLRSGVTLAQARHDLDTLAARMAREYGSDRQGAAIEPVRETIVGDVRGALLLLQTAVGVVLLVACANISSLLVARAAARRRELAIRTSIGATRAQLVGQLLMESLVLGIAGGLLGLLLGAWLTAGLVQLLPAGMPRVRDIGLDRTVTLVTFSAALFTSVLFGILPALQASRVDAVTALKESGDRGSMRARGRAALVVAETALTLVLLVCAGLLVNSLLHLQRIDSGMRVEQVTIAALNLPQSRYPTAVSQTQLYQRLIEGLSGHHELRAAGVGFPGPLRGENATGHFFIQGRPRTAGADQPFACVAAVSSGYLDAIGVRLLQGRTVTNADSSSAGPVVMVSATLARRYWPRENPIGKHVRFEDTPAEPWMTVVGVGSDVRQLGLHEPPPPVMYVPYQQFPLPFTTVAVRSSLPEAATASLVRAELATIDPDLPFSRIEPLTAIVERSMDQPRFRTRLLGLFALLALVLAAVGVYGLISHSVAQRSREIGIRVALGARPREVLMSIMREGTVLAAGGIAIGLAGSLIATRLLARFLFGVSATDPWTFLAVAAILFAVALVASYLPARRALGVDPLTALRAE